MFIGLSILGLVHVATRVFHHRKHRARTLRALPSSERQEAKANVRKQAAIQHRNKAPEPLAHESPAEAQANRLLRGPFTWSKCLSLADMYARGHYPHWAPNEQCAESLYRCCASCPDGEVAGLAQQKFVELRTHGAPIDSSDWADGSPRMPPRYMDAALQSAHKQPWHASTQTRERPRWPTSVEARAVSAVFGPGGEAAADPLMPAPWEVGEGAPRAGTVVITADREDNAHRLDSQNVHDHTVARTVKHNLAKLNKSMQPGELLAADQALCEVTDFVLSDGKWDAETKGNVLDVLDSLNDKHNESAGMSQRGALATVWSALTRVSDPQKRQNVRETLVDQLGSAKEHGNVVCSTGRIARIAGALDGVDMPELGPHEDARPMWVVRDEIANLAARVRDKHDTDGASGQSDARKELEDSVNTEYVERLGFSPEVMNPIVREYAQAL